MRYRALNLVAVGRSEVDHPAVDQPAADLAGELEAALLLEEVPAWAVPLCKETVLGHTAKGLQIGLAAARPGAREAYLQADLKEWIQGLVRTYSTVGQWKAEDCMAKHRAEQEVAVEGQNSMAGGCTHLMTAPERMG